MRDSCFEVFWFFWSLGIDVVFCGFSDIIEVFAKIFDFIFSFIFVFFIIGFNALNLMIKGLSVILLFKLLIKMMIKLNE